MRNGVVAVLLVAVIALGAGAGYLVGTENGHTTTLQTHGVEFVQESNCPYESLIVPWGVEVGHQTVTQPSNATLPLSYASSRLTSNSTYSTIWFSLPQGTYTYSILPNNFHGQEVSGNVTVDGSGVVVPVTAFITAMGCSSTSSAVTTTCSGYPPGGDCVATYNYTFTVSVNYTGPWKLTYQGNNVSGNDTGSGFFSKDVTLSGLDTNMLTLCATAQKLDGSNNTLILTVTGYNETSLPYGVTSYCGGVVP
jgi:hypothetical protein